jgi:16S rRNA (cytosine1402-N4)-methyltransferase
MNKIIHKTVLLHETIEGLALAPGDVVVDCTLGSGGHSEAVCTQCPEVKVIIGVDADSDAIARSTERVKDSPCSFIFRQSNFSTLGTVLDELGHTKVNKFIFDLGFSSDQLEASGRGFSFKKDEPLLMTLTDTITEATLTAREIVNEWQEESIADIIYGYGEEQFSRRIAKGIVEAREEKPIETTFDLIKIIESSVPFFYRKGKIHCATKTFQALRIAVNNEIENLKTGLAEALMRLAPKGRIAVISFHSLEDRVVKHFFKNAVDNEIGTNCTKKPIVPTSIEVKENPRSRSSKLRIFQKN